MSGLNIGDRVGRWFKTECSDCGELFYVTRTSEKILTKKDLTCSDCFEHSERNKELNKLEKENATLRQQLAEKEILRLKELEGLGDRLDSILYWARCEIENNAQLIPCDDGVARFASLGAVNGAMSRVKRAMTDDEYASAILNGEMNDKQ